MRLAGHSSHSMSMAWLRRVAKASAMASVPWVMTSCTRSLRKCLETYPSARDRPAAFADKEIEAGDPEGSSMQIDTARRTSRDGRSQERFSNTF